MAKITYRTILVVGDNHEEIVKKYSADTKVEKHLRMEFNDAGKEKKKHLALLEKLFTDKRIVLPESLYEKYKSIYLMLKDMDTFDYFKMMTEGCEYDEETGDAWTTKNDNAFYCYERCQQHRLEVTGDEGDFSDPFPLKDGTVSYSARYNDIDWSKVHMNPEKTKLNERVWELVVEGDEPNDDSERMLVKRLHNRRQYFENFKNKEEFVKHSSSLWYWGIATEKDYHEVNYKVSDLEWVTDFFEKYIKPLEKENPLLTIYEVHCLVE